MGPVTSSVTDVRVPEWSIDKIMEIQRMAATANFSNLSECEKSQLSWARYHFSNMFKPSNSLVPRIRGGDGGDGQGSRTG